MARVKRGVVARARHKKILKQAKGYYGSDDILTAPKLEPLDDDFNLDDVTEAPLATTQAPFVAAANQPKQKRPRGRPRKHPVAPIINPSKVTKGRSKTGCITCRRRKKKCDEAKPRCKCWA